MSESVNPVADALRNEFPLLWDMAYRFDFAERLGGCLDPLLAEVDAAMRELHMARTNLAAVPVSVTADQEATAGSSVTNESEQA